MTEKTGITSSYSNKKEQSDILLSLSTRGAQIFDFSNTESKLTKSKFEEWEKQIDEVLIDLKKLTRKDVILSVHSSVLLKACPKILDPLQYATFELFAYALVDNLMSIHPEDAPITILIESISKVHLNCIDTFASLIDDSDNNSSKERQVMYKNSVFIHPFIT
jgi:hypothetical protein